jgi:hypothetical protein
MNQKRILCQMLGTVLIFLVFLFGAQHSGFSFLWFLSYSRLVFSLTSAISLERNQILYFILCSFLGPSFTFGPKKRKNKRRMKCVVIFWAQPCVYLFIIWAQSEDDTTMRFLFSFLLLSSLHCRALFSNKN